jgi:hypothetical protein
MITADEARQLSIQYYDYECKFKEYEEDISQAIKELATQGRRTCATYIKEVNISQMIAQNLSTILIQNGYSVKLIRKGYYYGLVIMW